MHRYWYRDIRNKKRSTELPKELRNFPEIDYETKSMKGIQNNFAKEISQGTR